MQCISLSADWLRFAGLRSEIPEPLVQSAWFEEQKLVSASKQIHHVHKTQATHSYSSQLFSFLPGSLIISLSVMQNLSYAEHSTQSPQVWITEVWLYNDKSSWISKHNITWWLLSVEDMFSYFQLNSMVIQSLEKWEKY